MIQIVSPQAVNPSLRDSIYRERLFRSVSASYVSLGWARNFYRNMIREYGGPTYGQQDGARTKYINKIAQFINAYTMILAGNTPQAVVETDYRELQAFAKHWTVNLNGLLKIINIKQEFQDCAKNTLFMAGFIKVHYADSGHVVFENDVEADPGLPYASSFSIEDWVHDASVKKLGRCRFAGDKYRMAMSQLERGLEMGMYEERAAADIMPTSKMEHDRERAELIGNGQETDDDEVEPMFDAIDLYDYEDRKICTYALSDTRRMMPKGEAIAEVEWEGLETGPYHMYRLNTVPDNIMPKSPLSDLEAMDRFLNSMARRTVRAVDNQKENLVYTPAGKDAAQALASSKDRETIMVTDTRDVDVIKQGGVDPGTQQTLSNFLNLFDEMAGNLKQILGLGASAETLGQEQIIQQAGTRMGNFMEDRFQDESERVLANLSKLMYRDEFLEIESSIMVDSTGPSPIYVNSSWAPGDREGEDWQYLFKIVPYSARLRTPAEKVATVTQVIQNLYIPLQEQLMAQGGMVDMMALNELLADNLNMPEFRNIITFMGGTVGGGPAKPEKSGKPSVSQRNYTRRNIPSSALNSSAANNWQSGGVGVQQPQTSRRSMSP